jgi:phosphate transport system protein
LTRLLDLGLQKITTMVLDMAELSSATVETAVQAYIQGIDKREEIVDHSEKLRALEEEVSELSVEVIARYQPVASDLRYVKSCMEIAYGFSRFGRYALDIAEALALYGDLSSCDKTDVKAAGQQCKNMIQTSIKAFTEKDPELASKLGEMDDVVDDLYRGYIKRLIADPKADTKCAVAGALVLRYLERIADHATYIGGSVLYTVTGEKQLRK